jgi:aspartate carbamoyltransferase catalytic subunit
VSAGQPIPLERPGWPHRHLLDTADLTIADVETVMDVADRMSGALQHRGAKLNALDGLQVTNLFYEASTRTRVSFEVAARRLSASVVNVAASSSSVTKGESLIDTVRTLEALGSDVLVIRHPRSGAPYLAARHFGGHVVNAGDGWHAHPTQALVDLYTLRRRLPGGRIRGRKIVIVGDVLHSRVARSNVWTLTAFGADLWLCGPPTFVRGFDAWAAALPAGRRLTVTTDLRAALDGAHAVMALRIQQERQEVGLLPSLREYSARYAITADRLRFARDDVLVLHPGPMNEGVEIDPDVATSGHSVITEQVRNGLPIRMAVLQLVAAPMTRLEAG